MVYILKLSWWQTAMKSSPTDIHIRLCKSVGLWNTGQFKQPGSDVSHRGFYCILLVWFLGRQISKGNFYFCTSLISARRDWGKPSKALVKPAGVQAKIQTRHLSKTSLKRYCYTIPLNRVAQYLNRYKTFLLLWNIFLKFHYFSFFTPVWRQIWHCPALTWYVKAFATAHVHQWWA